MDKEIRRMERLAKHLRNIRKHRPLTNQEENLARRSFTGIHRRFLSLALEDETRRDRPPGRSAKKAVVIS